MLERASEISKPYRKANKLTNLTFAVLTAIAPLTPVFSPSAEARTISSPRPNNISETPCSLTTLIEGESPQMEIGNRQLTIRGYSIDNPARRARFKMAFEPDALPDNSIAISGSNIYLDLVVIVEKATPENPSPVIAIRYEFAADEEENVQKETPPAILPKIRMGECNIGELDIDGRYPNLYFNQAHIVISDRGI